MGKLHSYVSVLAVAFVLVIGVAECRKIKENELVDGFGGGGLGGGAGGGFGGGAGAGIGGGGGAGGGGGRRNRFRKDNTIDTGFIAFFFSLPVACIVNYCLSNQERSPR